MGTVLKIILGWLGKLLGGPFAAAAVQAYQAKLDAEGSHEARTADLVARELDLQGREAALRTQLLIAEQGSWLTRSIRPAFAWPVIIYLGKIFIYDKTLGAWTHGSTDDLSPGLWSIALTIIAAYFGGQTIKDSVSALAGVFRK